jgi:flavin reductase (DIM6/NTAB) family NADH-FMN oxidoreductase RutF|tara:strand:- start:446 stop:928 length:483 start_codon:yes stop_codon:yes gene_type:complete
MPIDPKLQRTIMGRFATGVTVVTMKAGDTLWGMTANAVTSLSLDPSLVLVCVDKTTQTHEFLNQAGAFAMNILAEDQEELSNRFATPGPKEFGDLDFVEGETGSPVLAGTLGYVDCTLKEVLAGGDHDIFIGEIVHGEDRVGEEGAGRPLLYFGGYARLG